MTRILMSAFGLSFVVLGGLVVSDAISKDGEQVIQALVGGGMLGSGSSLLFSGLLLDWS